MIEAGLTFIVLALVLLSVALAARSLTYRQRAIMAFIASGLSATGSLLSFLSRYYN